MKTKLTLLFILFLMGYWQARAVEVTQRIVSHQRKGQAIFFKCENGNKIKLSVVTAGMIRFQMCENGIFSPSKMIELGFVKDDFPAANYDFFENDEAFLINTSLLNVKIEKGNFRMNVFDKQGNLIVRSNKERGILTGKTNEINMDMPGDEHFFGFGFMRKTLDARGHTLRFERKYRWKEATVPFFMSTRGYAFYSNSVFNHDFDFTTKTDGVKNDYYSIKSAGGDVDFYLIYGPDFPTLLDRYTDLTGKSMMIPKWAFGLEYRLRYFGDQNELLEVAKEFREKEIPCDIMALEPGWEEVPYSMKWKWSPERFPDPKKMIAELDKMGFKLDLWESGKAPVTNITDKNTRKQWYDQRKEIVDMGVRMFKQDDPYPRSIISSELLDPVFAKHRIKDKQLTAEELNNVANSLYSETLFNEFRAQTNERAVVMFHAYNASVASQRWPFQWAGDFQAENGMLNACLSGHAVVSYDIRNPYAAGWHQGFFTPFSVVDSWAYYREPWLYSESIEESHRIYACLRSRLVPYLYSSLWQSHKVGLPIERPMVLNDPSDHNTYQMKSQFMVGDWFLLALSDVDDSPAGEKIDFWTGSQKGNHGRIYLPKGKWINYWNGEVHEIEEAQWITDDWPEYLGGLLFVKAGAIVPMGQVKNYVGETNDEVLVIDVYPSGSSHYQLYEDDGLTYSYEKGEYAVTNISCEQSENKVKINLSERKGTYVNMPETRSYIVKVHSLLKPKQISVDGEELMFFKNKKALVFSETENGWYYDELAKKAILKLDKGWKYMPGDDGLDPLATIPLTPKNERIVWRAENKSNIKTGAREIILSMPDLAVPYFSSNMNTIPADGLSLANIDVNFKNVKQRIGKVFAKIEGAATFKNGKTEMILDAERGISYEIISGTKPGTAVLSVSGSYIEKGTFEFPVYGNASRLEICNDNSVLVADNSNVINLTATLYDQNGNVVNKAASPIVVSLSGEGSFMNGLKIDSVFIVDGVAPISVKSTAVAGMLNLDAKFRDLQSNTIVIASQKGEMQVRINPPEKVKLSSDGGWIPDQVDVFVNFIAGGNWVKNSTNMVVLNVYNKDKELLATYSQNAKNGEVIFKDITYYKRPAQCLFEIVCEGYDTVTKKVFANTF